MSRNYRCVKFVHLFMSSLGVFSDECSTFLDMMNDIGIDKKQQHYIIKKMVNIAIRSTYFIFCCRNRNWDSPDFWFFFVFDFFSFLFFKMFWIIQSQAHCKMKRAYLAPKMGPKRVWQKNPHAKNFYLLLHFTYLIQIQQRLREIFKEPPLISYRRGKSLKDLLVRAKLWRSYYFQYDLVQGSCDARRLFLTI